MAGSVDAVASWGLADGEEWTKLLAVADFGFLGGAGGLANVSLRCKTWGIVRGIKCRIASDKVVEGQAHGRALSGTALLRNQAAITNLWRRPPTQGAVWTLIGAIGADGCGHWTSPSLKEIYAYVGDAPQQYLYALSDTQPGAGTIGNLGVAYTREYIVGIIGKGKRYPDLWHGPWDRTYLVWKDDSNKVQLQKSTNAGRTWTDAQGVTPTGWTYPAVCKGIQGELLVAATSVGGAKTKVWKSRDDGASFASLAMSFAATRMDIAEGVGLRRFGTLLDGTQQEFRVTTEDFSTTLNRPSALASGGSSVKTSTVIATGMGAARAAVAYDRGCNLFAAVQNAASHVKLWRSREDGFGWQSTARSFAATDPDVTQGPCQKAYLAARSGATVRWWIGIRQLSTIVASATITMEADAERPAVWKLNSRGREALAAVTVGGTIRIYGSKDDGRTWSQKA